MGAGGGAGGGGEGESGEGGGSEGGGGEDSDEGGGEGSGEGGGEGGCGDGGGEAAAFCVPRAVYTGEHLRASGRGRGGQYVFGGRAGGRTSGTWG